MINLIKRCRCGNVADYLIERPIKVWVINSGEDEDFEIVHDIVDEYEFYICKDCANHLELLKNYNL